MNAPLPALKYNPGMRGDQDLIDRFLARQRDLSWILGRIRETQGAPGQPCQHMLVIGARGMGKTTLVRRVAAEVRREASLAAHWYPIVFPEESYLPSTAGEFWLEAIFQLAGQLAGQPAGEELRQAYEDLRKERDEARLDERCLGVLLDYAERADRRLLVVVENLGMLLGEQIGETDAWRLRKTLSHEPRLLVLATAVTRFEEIDGVDQAWFELFAEHVLDPLSREECEAVWTAVQGRPSEGDSIRAVEILTGGNARLVTIMAEFSIERSFRELMDRLVELVDSHTEYFKSHLDALPAQERKVFAVLLDLWAPATAAQVAERARLTPSLASAQLKRLVGRGAVTITGAGKRDRRYQVTERLFNLYYLLRRRGENREKAEMLVSFMRAMYSEGALRDVIRGMTPDLMTLSPEERREWFAVIAGLVRESPELVRVLTPWLLRRLGAPGELLEISERVRGDLIGDPILLEVVNSGYGTRTVTLEELRHAVKAKMISPAAASAVALFRCWRLTEPSEQEDALSWATLATDFDDRSGGAWLFRGFALLRLKSLEEAWAAFERALEIDQGEPAAWVARISVHRDADDFIQVIRRFHNSMPDAGGLWRSLTSINFPIVELPDNLRWAVVARMVCSPDHRNIDWALFFARQSIARGEVPEFLAALADEDHFGHYDVLTTALRIHLGQTLEGSRETLEVAGDLARALVVCTEVLSERL